jgi:catechol 2,3-dioxygenase-like lactoylglutathione lyase family enzyme
MLSNAQKSAGPMPLSLRGCCPALVSLNIQLDYKSRITMQQSDLAIPILPSRSIAATVAFYRQLGFEGGAHEFDSGYAVLRRGDVEIHFFAHKDLVPEESSAGCYIRVKDVDSFFDAFAAISLPKRGIPRMDALEDKPWGLREFAIVDPDGSLLRIGQLL